MRNSSRVALIIALASGLASCSDPVSPELALVIHTTLNSVSIRNTADEAQLYSFVIDEGAAPYTDWIPCVQDDCGRIAPGGVRTVMADDIDSGPGAYVLVYTWRMSTGPADEPTAGPIAMHRVRLTEPLDP